MPDEPDSIHEDAATPPSAALPSILGGMSPDELFARGMQSVRMTGGGSLQSWEPPSIAEAARLFPNYQITEMIGRGGMGVVYKGRQTSLDRVVAIKLLPLEVSVDRDFGDRFVREARTMAKMNHPNIVSVFDFGHTTEGHLYFVMEFVEGTTLHQMIKSVGLTPAQSLELIVGVCEALQYAHGEGVVHRDIKPANILVDTKGRVKVTDFGLARMDTTKTPEQWGQTMTGMVLGTPDYMSPEQKKGARVDHRADIYSLGVMLYEMLCGVIPAGIFDPPSHRVAVDERVDQVVIRAMQQEPDRRYANTAEMKTAVEMIRNTPLPAKPESQATLTPLPSNGAAQIPSSEKVRPRGPRHEAPVAKHHAPIGTYIAAGSALIAVGLLLWNQFRTPPPPRTDPSPAPVGPIVATNKPDPKIEPPTADPTPTVPEQFGPPATLEILIAAATPVKTPEPVAPVTPPAPDKPVAVVDLNPPVISVTPKPVGFPQITPVQPPNPVVVTPPPPDPEVSDWRRFVASGDNFMRRRQADEAIDAYAEALDVAQANPKGVSLPEFGRVCMSLGTLEIQNGSPAEARRILVAGRQFLIKNKAPGSTIDQIESVLKKLPRD